MCSMEYVFVGVGWGWINCVLVVEYDQDTESSSQGTSALRAVMSRGCVCMLVCLLVVGYDLDMYLCLEGGDVKRVCYCVCKVVGYD